ncbi:hypothetical protein HF086_008307 [Spodoptera exigua]|uniref:Uncharacterized protein n=1 Tax=Spodoptera exigua TaxID=7107 RepID=A0A922SH87_SPOEX|nr:hypothetical protein HF086_008307 [Spodoptera exigua]
MTETVTVIESNNLTLDGSTNSMPNISDDDDEVKSLRQEILTLRSELNSAHQEINNLSLENTELRNTIKNLSSKYEVLTKATKQLSSDLCTRTPINSKSTTPHRPTHKKNKSKSAQPASTPSAHQNTDTVRGTASLSHIVQQTTKQTNKIPKVDKPKLCIISSNRRNKVLTIAENAFADYHLCHYLKPNCGVRELISGIDTKLKEHTVNDYCVVLIGEEDFRRTYNYVDIIIDIREKLTQIQHTNIILCLPTYKINDYSIMYNGRIETFCNLLYLDMCT